jgi:hypothetical protein
MLRKFATELSTKFGPETEPDRQKLAAREAHAVGASAELLGFIGFAQDCREIEASSAPGPDFDLLLRRCQTSRDRVVRRLSELDLARVGAEAPLEGGRR